MTDAITPDAITPGPITPQEFAAWAARLGLTRLSPDDLETLRAGWIGLGPQLALVRATVGPDDKPPRPPLGVTRWPAPPSNAA